MNPETIPRDIYKLLCSKETPLTELEVDKVIDDFSFAVGETLREALRPDQERKGRLRLSAIGYPDRKIYNSFHGAPADALTGATRVKFLYGHIIEAMLLCLTELSGHQVKDKQKQCEVGGVLGSMDCTIDGWTADVKSCSTFGYKKFKDKTLPFDDPFGYVGQLKAYAHSEGNQRIGWLAMDKQNGNVCWLGYDLEDLHPAVEEALSYDIEERVEQVKKLVGLNDAPGFCNEPLADGESGNLKLASGCAYCDFKKHCYPGMRTFLYGSGPKYLIHVEKEPRVSEMVEGF